MEFWELGDYEIVGEWFADASRSVLDDGAVPADLSGRSVLDVACGTGAVAIEAARRGAVAVGVDATPGMLAAARRRAAAAGVEVGWVQRSFEALAGLDPAEIVTSSFGVMFAGDPAAVASQLDAVTTPDGVIAVTAWHHDGAFGSTVPALVELIGSSPVDVCQWSDPDRVGSFFAATGRTVTHHRRGVAPIGFADIPDAIDQMRRYAGGWIMVFERLAAAGLVEQGERALADHLAAHSDPTSTGIALRAEYTVTHLTR